MWDYATFLIKLLDNFREMKKKYAINVNILHGNMLKLEIPKISLIDLNNKIMRKCFQNNYIWKVYADILINSFDFLLIKYILI